MPFFDVYPTAPPITISPPRADTPIMRLEELIGHFLDHCLINGSHDKTTTFPTPGIPLEQLQDLADALAAEGRVRMIDLKIVPWYLKWWDSGPVSDIVVHF